MTIRDVLDVATPALRPPWSGRKTLLTAEEATVLELCRIHTERLRYRTVYDCLGGERAWGVLNRLRDRGEIEHVAYDFWRITELGRDVLRAYSKQPTSTL